MPKVIGRCFYCLEEKELCDAHIIPVSFLGDVVEKGYLEVSTNSERTKRSRIGPYDQKILCAFCDGGIGIYDDYAKKLLIDEIENYKAPNRPVYLVPKDRLDYTKLKKFFISLMFRASITSHPIFQQASLGKYTQAAIQMIRGDIPLQNEIFAVLIFKNAPTVKYSDVISCVRTKLAKTYAYKFHFSGYQVTIVPNSSRMDWGGIDEDVSPESFFLRQGEDLIVLELHDDLSGKTFLLSKVRNTKRSSRH